jgi:hypothetical protein
LVINNVDLRLIHTTRYRNTLIARRSSTAVQRLKNIPDRYNFRSREVFITRVDLRNYSAPLLFIVNEIRNSLFNIDNVVIHHNDDNSHNKIDK